MRITTIEYIVIPFRAPEIHNFIINSDLNRYFYFDQDWNIERRFNSIDDFQNTFKQWVHFKLPNYHMYTTSGSTEAISYCLNNLSHRNKRIAMVENDYRWYQLVADKLKIPFDVITRPDQLTKNHVFITSVPFCKDGNCSFLQEELLDKCNDDNIECWLDCAYYGSGKPINFIIPESTTNMFFSFSKNFGLSLNRFGVWLSEKSIKDREILEDVGYLNLGTVDLVTDLMKNFSHDYMWKNYRHLQLAVTNNPTNIIFMSKEGCITKLLLDKIKEDYKSF